MLLNRYALRALRERSGLSLSDLARLAGISQPHLSNLERGHRRPSPATLRRLADALKVPVLALVADPDGAEPAATPSERVVDGCDDEPVGPHRPAGAPIECRPWHDHPRGRTHPAVSAPTAHGSAVGQPPDRSLLPWT